MKSLESTKSSEETHVKLLETINTNHRMHDLYAYFAKNLDICPTMLQSRISQALQRPLAHLFRSAGGYFCLGYNATVIKKPNPSRPRDDEHEGYNLGFDEV